MYTSAWLVMSIRGEAQGLVVDTEGTVSTHQPFGYPLRCDDEATYIRLVRIRGAQAPQKRALQRPRHRRVIERLFN